MRLIDEQFLETPWYGSRQMARHLRRRGWRIGRHRVRRLMLKMGLAPISWLRPRDLTFPPVSGMRRAQDFRLTYSKVFELFIADMTRIRMGQKIFSHVSFSGQGANWNDLDHYMRYGIGSVRITIPLG